MNLKEFKESNEFQERIIKVLFVLASQGGKLKLPTLKEYALSELIGAVVEHITGKECHLHFDKVDYGDWGENIRKNFEESIKNNHFTDKLERALRGLVDIHWENDELGDGEWECWAMTIYSISVRDCNGWSGSTFSLLPKFIQSVEEEDMPLLGEDILQHCQKIAGIMTKYIEKDLAYIKEHYCW